ncbi:hypothetical protein ART_4202 [Arthrobacter sp. PAMC 25486]|nr:hypothetical protein ART_4202 [Arthrobacter sp. PAMC 25486]
MFRFTRTNNSGTSFTIPQQSTGLAGPAAAPMDGNFDHTAMFVKRTLQRFRVRALLGSQVARTLIKKAVSVTDAQTDVHVASEGNRTADGSTLVEALKTTARLVPRQLNDEVELAKLELGDKKSRLGGIAVFAGTALVFLVLLVIALTVAGIAGLATVMPLWLSALLVSAGLLVVIGICALVAYKKSKALLPIIPEHAWRGIRHDLGIARHGRDFDPGTLDAPVLTRAEKKARDAQAAEDKARAAAERVAKEAEHGPQASTSELIKRTEARRAHLLDLREELVEEADVKKQAGYFLDTAKNKAMDKVNRFTGGTASQATALVKERWKPLAVLAGSGTLCIVLLRKLIKK